jgi:hypothetical protein
LTPFDSYRTNVVGYFIDAGFKGGPAIAPEIRLPAGSTNVHEFDVTMGETMMEDGVVDAWMTVPFPASNAADFEQLYVYRPRDTNVMRLVMQLKPGRSVKMRFNLVVLREHAVNAR